MLRNVVAVFTFFVALLMAGAVFADDSPTLHQIYDAAQAGRLNDAQGMINQVLKEHPNSAKAHYVDAEILAKTGNMNQARAEFANAERLDPGLPFATPQAVQNLKSMLSASQAGIVPATANRIAQPSFPWGLLLLGISAIVIITLIVRAFARPAYASAGYPGNFQTGMSPGYMPGGMGGYAPMAPVAPGMGSGIMSGLATGAALGAGMVAGEELAHHFLDGNGNAVPQAQAMNTAWDTQSDNMGGNDFGVADNSSWDDNSGIADISGGNDWT
ncbi:MAG: tetratricopeptide repeat protein [Gallionella sp.]